MQFKYSHRCSCCYGHAHLRHVDIVGFRLKLLWHPHWGREHIHEELVWADYLHAGMASSSAIHLFSHFQIFRNMQVPSNASSSIA